MIQSIGKASTYVTTSRQAETETREVLLLSEVLVLPERTVFIQTLAALWDTFWAMGALTSGASALSKPAYSNKVLEGELILTSGRALPKWFSCLY